MTTNAWLVAARPKTLGAGIAPVIVGTALAVGDNLLHWPSAVCALLGALLIQIGTNYANDYFDFVKGTDTTERIGPTRATQAGLVSPRAMRWATALVFLLACVPGAYLVWRAGWPLVAIGVASIVCGILYTGGPFPLGYLGLGDLFVLVFFGPVAVGGTYYVQTLTITPSVLLAGFAPGLFSVAILTVNNLRDIDQDRAGGKRTLAVRFGQTFARYEYAVSLFVGAVVVPFILQCVTGRYVGIAAFSFVPAWFAIRTAFASREGVVLNQLLATTGKLLLFFSVLFSVGVML